MRKGSARDILLSPALPTSARMSPTRLSLGRVASLQSPLLFHLVPSFRTERIVSRHTRRVYKGKRYWPSSCRMYPCWEA
jgi:hypothetical protein